MAQAKVAAKIAFIGYPRVGKSTLLKMATGCRPPLDYKPTIGLDLGNMKLCDSVNGVIWDIGGQKNFQPLWDSFLEGADLIVTVTDSTPKNVLQTKQIVDMVARKRRKTRVIAIANKQDQDGHMNAKRVEDVLQVPTYPMVAIEEKNKDNFQMVIIEELIKATEPEKGEKDGN
ncbi:MAG: ADP-ribosylation factor-like protein [Candidatus Helarchaeota archaeon]